MNRKLNISKIIVLGGLIFAFLPLIVGLTGAYLVDNNYGFITLLSIYTFPIGMLVMIVGLVSDTSSKTKPKGQKSVQQGGGYSSGNEVLPIKKDNGLSTVLKISLFVIVIWLLYRFFHPFISISL